MIESKLSKWFFGNDAKLNFILVLVFCQWRYSINTSDEITQSYSINKTINLIMKKVEMDVVRQIV